MSASTLVGAFIGWELVYATALGRAMIAQEIVDDLEAALEQFRLIAADLNDSADLPTA